MMGWYYCTSERVIPVSVGNGEVVGVRPYTHVFIDPRMEGRGEVQRYVSLGHLQRSGNPGRGATKAVPAQPIAQKAVEGSAGRFSDSIVMEAPVAKMKPVADAAKVSTPESRATEQESAPQKTTRRRRKAKAEPASDE